MQVGQINLQQGERITNTSLGDTDRWMMTQSYVGTKESGHVIILLKPTVKGILTNLVIITNKRVYNFNVQSKADVFSPDVRFDYSEDTMNKIVATQNQAIMSGEAKLGQEPVSDHTVIDYSHLNFNYSLSGDHPSWSPTRIFDDGTHTMIKFSPMIDRVSLPVVFVYINGIPAMVNYRYHRPYMIIDRLFDHAELVSGKGDAKVAIQIRNNN